MINLLAAVISIISGTSFWMSFFVFIYGPWREKGQMDQIVFRGGLVHGEKKCRWTKRFSEGAWSMERKNAGGPNSFLWKFGPWREKGRVDQVVFCGSLVHGEKKGGWTKLFSEGAWSMDRKERVDQIVIRGSMVHGEKKCRWTK